MSQFLRVSLHSFPSFFEYFTWHATMHRAEQRMGWTTPAVGLTAEMVNRTVTARGVRKAKRIEVFRERREGVKKT